MIIALDGPSGAGKSTVAKAVAQKLGFACLDTGAMYRSVAWSAKQQGFDLADEAALESIARNERIVFECEPGEVMPKKIKIGGHDVTKEIRTREIDQAVSQVSAHPKVREALVEQQRRIGNEGNYVVEGRDIGTVVFPHAEVKVYLDASAEERAHRRVRQNVDRGIGSIEFEDVLADILRRDEIDSQRAASPLRPADDAHILDSTSHYIEEVIDEICSLAQKRMA